MCFFITTGKWTNHKGRSRRFTNPDELEEQRKRDEQERRWRKNNGGDDESSSEEEAPATKGDKSNSEDETESGSESDEDSDDVRIHSNEFLFFLLLSNFIFRKKKVLLV